MRRYLRVLLVAAMSLGLVFLLVSRSRTPRDAPGVEMIDAGEVGADAGVDAAGEASALPSPDAGAVLDAALDTGPPPAPARTLRVATLGWELAAPAAALGTAMPGAPEGGPPLPPIEIAPETSLDRVEARLARGPEADGADFAVLPLPAFVVAHERLRAIEPRAFLVVGFSHGREEVHAAPGVLLRPIAGDEVRLVGLAPSTASDPAAVASGSEAATILGLFVLDAVGVPPSRVRIVAPGTADAKLAPVAAIVRGAADERKLALSTADASRLVPIVAVAPRSVLDARAAELREISRAWLEGAQRAGREAPAVARRLSGKDGVVLASGTLGAPDAVTLVERLGRIEPVELAQQRALVESGPRGAVTLGVLMQRTWQLARGGGLTASAAPDALPIDGRVVSAIAPPAVEAPRAPEADAGAALGTVPAGATPLFVYRAEAQADAPAIIDQIGWLAGVFERSVLRVAARGGDKAARALAQSAREALGLPPSRIAVSAAEPVVAPVTVEILSRP